MTQPVKYTNVPHLLQQQAEAEDAMLLAFKEGDYTLEAPLVRLNPYLISPLAAMVLFRTEQAVSVEICVKGKEAAGDIRHSFPAGTEHILPIYGLYVDYANTVVVTLSDGRSQQLTIQTLPAHDSLKTVTSIETTAEYMDGNLMFVTVARNAIPAAYDYAGDCRWYSPLNFNFDLKRIANGHCLIGSDRFVAPPYNTSGLVELTMSGKIFNEYRLPGGYHHDQWELENGDILVLTQDLERGTVEDMCVMLDRQTGQIIKTWDYQTILPQFPTAGSGSQDAEDWFHNNAVWYDKKTNSLTLSGRHQDAIINIDFESGQLNWIIGDPEGWPQEMVDKYFFTPVGDGEFDWQYEQHACVVCPDGDIMAFDNGHFRSKNPDSYVLGQDNFSRGVRYHIDTDKMTIQQVWQYGKERGNSFFSPYICNVEYYAEGHYLIHSGGIAWKDGKTPEGLGSRLSMKDPTVTLESITVEQKDGQVMFEMHLPANYYRAEKMPVYAPGEVAQLGHGQLLGTLGVTKETKAKIPASSGQPLPEQYQASITEEADRIQFNATFDEGEYALLILTGADGTVHKYPINTVAHDSAAMCVGTFQKADPRNIDKFVSKEGLSGQYTVQVLCGEHTVYETGVTITA